MSRLTVKQLIKELKKMPPDALVVWKDHDHSEGEFNNHVGFIDDVSEEFSTDPETRIVAIRP